MSIFQKICQQLIFELFQHRCNDRSCNCLLQQSHGESKIPTAPSSIFTILLFCSWAWSMVMFEKWLVVFLTVMCLSRNSLYTDGAFASKHSKFRMKTGNHLAECTWPRENIQETMAFRQKPLWDKHEQDDFQWHQLYPIMCSDWCIDLLVCPFLIPLSI